MYVWLVNIRSVIVKFTVVFYIHVLNCRYALSVRGWSNNYLAYKKKNNFGKSGDLFLTTFSFSSIHLTQL